MKFFFGIIILVGCILSLIFFIGKSANNDNKVKLIYPDAKITTVKKVYKPSESPKFTIKIGRSGDLTNSKFPYTKSAWAKEDVEISIYILDSKKNKTLIVPEVERLADGIYEVLVPSAQSFQPGRYTLITEIKNSKGHQVLYQDFSWGVLAINTNKSIYSPNEKARLAFSVLNEGGFNVCDAKVDLKIIDPKGEEYYLSTSNGKISKAEECLGSEVTNSPDYASTFQVKGEGVYTMELSAVTKNGKYQIQDLFEVKKDAPFDIERKSATRVNPVSPYEMKITIVAKRDFVGEIREPIPESFNVTSNDAAVEISKSDIKRGKELIWNKKIEKGENITLSYTFDPPDISPEFYLLGKMKLVEDTTTVFEEVRAWQIAADPTKLMLLWDDNVATPSGWTCISCSTGDTFFQKFIRGATSYSAAGGGSNSHVSTVTADTISGATNLTKGDGIADAASVDHQGFLDGSTSISSGSNMPQYRSLRVISYDSGIPTGASAIPQGAIALFDTTVPAGWTRYSAQDGYYTRGDWTVTTGGSNTHTHTVTWTSLTGSDINVGVDGSGTANIPNHTHAAPSPGATASSDCNSNACEPPFINTILGKADSTTSIPVGMIGMFDGPPGTGWDAVSGASQPFNNKFFKPASSYGTTGGSATHNHASVLGNTGAAPAGTLGGGVTLNNAASSDHTHSITTTFNTGDNNLPVYVDVQMAKAASAPTVTSLTPVNVDYNSATLRSTVNPNNDSTTVTYRYDISNVACASLANTASYGSIGAGTVDVTPNEKAISDLLASTTYYYCVTATNGVGTTNSTVSNFSTSVAPARIFKGGLQIRGGTRL